MNYKFYKCISGVENTSTSHIYFIILDKNDKVFAFYSTPKTILDYYVLYPYPKDYVAKVEEGNLILYVNPRETKYDNKFKLQLINNNDSHIVPTEISDYINLEKINNLI